MTNDQLNRICAEAEGFTELHDEYHPTINYHWGWKSGSHELVPNYGEDLNAMHRLEKVLKYEPDYILQLVQLLDAPDGRGDWDDEELWARVVMATAAQRREAFVRTIGKWEDS